HPQAHRRLRLESVRKPQIPPKPAGKSNKTPRKASIFNVFQQSPRIKIRNNRIGANGFLNQRCAFTPDLESILHARTGKIVLQQNLPKATAVVRRNELASCTDCAANVIAARLQNKNIQQSNRREWIDE